MLRLFRRTNEKRAVKNSIGCLFNWVLKRAACSSIFKCDFILDSSLSASANEIDKWQHYEMKYTEMWRKPSSNTACFSWTI